VLVLGPVGLEDAEGCIAEHTILEFLAGELQGDKLGRVQSHLDACSACIRVVVVVAGEQLRTHASAGHASAARASAANQRRSGIPPRAFQRSDPASGDSAAWPRASLADALDARELLSALRVVEDDEYVVEREVARGGMGRILLAIDRQGRRVALKVLLGRGEDATARFVREMQITARLQHPSIITLHEAGRWRSGEPFFAMKFVEGRSLRDELAELPSLKQRLALVPRLISVTDALAYAHDRGVIHRDLKPGNVLVGAFGETVVIDWGLAKVRGAFERELPEPHDSMSSPPLWGELATELGATLGTPAYMAPEQARGETLDERADVYGLGALLYHTLAGQPPYTGKTGREVLRSVISGPPRPLEERITDLPAELGAIVRKAMLPNAKDRYPSAKEMAEDLRRFAAGQLVLAHTYTFGTLLRRRLRQHRATVSVAIGLLVLGAVASALSVQRILRERSRAEVQSTIAATHQASAEHLVDFLITGFRERVKQADRLDLLVGLGDEVATYYRGIDGSGAVSGAGVLRSRAATLALLASVEFDKRKLDRARDLYRQALDLWDAADAAGAATPAELVRHGRTWQGLGVLEHVQGNAETALAAHERAIDFADRSVAGDANYLEGQLLAAVNLGRIAETLQHRKGDLEGSFETLTRALGRLSPFIAQHPDDIPLLQTLASLQQSMSDRQLARGHLDEAASSIQYSIDSFAHIAELDPQNATVAREYAYTFLFLAQVEVARGRLPEALRAQLTLLDRYAIIARADPGSLATEEDIAIGQMVHCQLLRRALRLSEAQSAGEKAVQILREHAQRTQAGKSQSLLVFALVDLSEALQADGKWDAAREHLQEAVDLSKKTLGQDARASKWQESLMLAQTWLANVQLKRGELAAAGAAARDARSLATSLAEQAPESAEAQENLARALIVVGDAAWAERQTSDARSAYEAARQSLERLSARSPAMVDYRVRLATASAKLAQALEGTPDGREPAARLTRAAATLLDDLEATGRLFPENQALRRALRAALAHPGQAFALGAGL
jgi:serine/threonine protein kinase